MQNILIQIDKWVETKYWCFYRSHWSLILLQVFHEDKRAQGYHLCSLSDDPERDPKKRDYKKTFSPHNLEIIEEIFSKFLQNWNGYTLKSKAVVRVSRNCQAPCMTIFF